MTAAAPQRPEECPDVAGHARPRPQSDHRPQRRYRCPSCGFWCLLAPAEGEERRKAHRRSVAQHPGCAECVAGKGTLFPGPGHKASTPGHAAHCSCDGCF